MTASEEALMESLTNELSFNAVRVAPDTELTIKSFRRFGNTVYCDLAAPSGTAELSLRIKHIGAFSGHTYVILMHSPEFTADDDVIPLMVLRVSSSITLRTVQPAEAKSAGAALLSQGPSAVQAITAVFGEIK